jgi:hypothetical protein
VESIPFDLEQPLPGALDQAFDFVLCHTVLEHVFDNQTAFANLRRMTRDVLVIVVPFLQDEHDERGSYGDFWRYTPASLTRLVAQDGLHVVSLSHNDNVWYPIYLLAVASRRPEFWREVLPTPAAGHARVGARWMQPGS